MDIKNRIKSLRKSMKEKGIDAYIIPSFDAHQSEYVPEHWKCRQWISGFTGSAGTVVIMQEDAGLWTDGRYYIQAEKQIKESGIRLFKMAEPGVPSYIEWLRDSLKNGECVGFDGKVFSTNVVRNMQENFKLKNIKLEYSFDLINEIWQERPSIPQNKIFSHDVKFAGKSAAEKIDLLRKEIRDNGATHYLVTTLDDIAWLFNIRGEDVHNTPVAVSYAVVSLDKAYLFIEQGKVPAKVKCNLEADGIELKDYYEVGDFLSKLHKEDTVIFDPEKTSIWLFNSINSETEKIEKANRIINDKAIKNDIEIDNLRKCQIRDGVAMVKFLKWIKSNIGKEKISEISAEQKLEDFRRERENFVGPSFDTIAGYKDHAAMMHYKPLPEIEYELNAKEMFLVDSGGQYLDGTTDITRTIILGKISEEQKRDFTLVLKSHIGLATAKFLYGATGSNLDILARKPLWDHGIDYKCGTGHGVGFFLSVHEQPQRFSQVPNNIKLEKGMIITNEPGIYKEGKHGIRTENTLLVIEDEKTDFGQFMRFETISYCPIDLDGIEVNMLTNDEKNWINNYHSDIYNKLYPYLDEAEREWLKNQTREI